MTAEKFRYAAVVTVSYGVDLLIAVLVMRGLSFSLPAASATGFLSAFVLNYVLHEFWTFRRADSSFSLSRLVETFGAALLTIAVRFGLLHVLAPFAVTEYIRIGLLVAAAGVSFLINYALLHFAVFR
jgi:putative flippase GtrA